MRISIKARTAAYNAKVHHEAGYTLAVVASPKQAVVHGEESIYTLPCCISMGFDDDLTIAAHKAGHDRLSRRAQTHERDDAYMLISVAGDIDITDLVDRNKGVHVMLPKAVFVEKK